MLASFLSVILLYLGELFFPLKNRSVIYNKPSLPRLVVKIFYSVTSFPKGALLTQASGFLSILQRRPCCKILSRNKGNLRLSISLSSHTLKGLRKERASGIHQTKSLLTYIMQTEVCVEKQLPPSKRPRIFPPHLPLVLPTSLAWPTPQPPKCEYWCT